MIEPRLTWKCLPATELVQDKQLQASWDELNACRSNLPILASYAVTAALRTFGRRSERLLIGLNGNTPAAMLLLQRTAPGQWSTFQPSQLPLGPWVARSDVSLLELTRQLLRGPLGASLVLSITQVDPLFAPRPDNGDWWACTDYIETGWIDIEGTAEDFWSARGKNLRSNLRKQRKKLAADGVQPSMTVLRAREEMAEAVSRYGHMESAGWKGGEGTAVHPENAQGRFYVELLEQAAERGEAKVYEYCFDDRVVASNLCVVRGGTVIVLKTTYDETVGKSVSPAFLLRQDEIEHAFAARRWTRLELYGRFRDWHSRWTDSKRTLYHLTAYRWSWMKTLRHLRQRASGRAPEVSA